MNLNKSFIVCFTTFISLILLTNPLCSKTSPELGRDKDPWTEADLNSFSLLYRKAKWSLLTAPGLRFMTDLIYPEFTISHMNKNGAIAFTIDDGFCGGNNQSGSLLNEVLDLFELYDANATFFTTGSHCECITKEDTQRLNASSHEIANHNMYDHPYINFTQDEFSTDLDATNQILDKLNFNVSKWYRAPFGRINDLMGIELNKRGLIHVVSDAFANDTEIPDAKWIAKYILNRVADGSIVLIHMPEKGFREWNLEAMELTLKGLREKNYKILTLTELDNLE